MCRLMALAIRLCMCGRYIPFGYTQRCLSLTYPIYSDMHPPGPSSHQSLNARTTSHVSHLWCLIKLAQNPKCIHPCIHPSQAHML